MDDAERLRALELRVERLEAELARRAAPATPEPRPPVASSPPPSAAPPRPDPEPIPAPEPVHIVPHVLGLSGVAALVLAATYLVRLAVDNGWLTPVRQLAIAALASAGLVSGGLWLRGTGRRYASFLSAAGVVVGFLTVYGAHLYYELIGSGLAGALVAGLVLLALALGRVFATAAYVLIAVVGAYSTPFLIRTESADVTNLALYYSGWSVLFCAYSLWLGGRAAYLFASLLAIVGFDLAWKLAGAPDWSVAAVYQAFQYVVFTVTAAVYSVRRLEAMTRAMARAHAPSLFCFYTIEYAVLDQHVPEAAPWIALASVLVVAAAYFLARRALLGPTPAGELVAWYTSLALFHAGYLELVPADVHPWIAPLLAVGLGLVLARDVEVPRPFALVVLGIGALNYLRVFSDVDMRGVAWGDLLGFLYAGLLYAGYALARRGGGERARSFLLYAAHVMALAAIHRYFDTSLLVSALWAAIAIGSLLLAWRAADRRLAQSSLLVFATSGLKVLIHDLEGSAPLVRIGCLAVLGVSLYAGGWIYQRIDADRGPGPEDSGR